ncbi:MAG: RebB family R body protein [Myxococcales bacterium]|nr:RebB family R body protein [Myxococcales bacterium]
MAFPTAVNDQITDSVTQASVGVLGDASSAAIGALYQVAAHATGILLQNTTAQQQASQSVNQAITGLIVQRLTGGQ